MLIILKWMNEKTILFKTKISSYLFLKGKLLFLRTLEAVSETKYMKLYRVNRYPIF